jgi:hypothetical protein
MYPVPELVEGRTEGTIPMDDGKELQERENGNWSEKMD